MNKAEKETYREKYNRIRKELIEELRPLAEIKSQLLTDIEIANRKDLANPTQLPIPALQSLRKQQLADVDERMKAIRDQVKPDLLVLKRAIEDSEELGILITEATAEFMLQREYSAKGRVFRPEAIEQADEREES
jgi:hypothetical protein